MKARGPLMVEHRLIERMIELIKKETLDISNKKEVNISFIDAAVDFIRTYADRTHHGKEEDILFKFLSAKKMSEDHKKMMQELIDEHKYGRSVVKELIDAREKYYGGKKEYASTIAKKLNILAEFYPKHIKKEDMVFFPQTEKYISEDENESMINDFWEFDRKMIHEKYSLIVNQLEDKI